MKGSIDMATPTTTQKKVAIDFLLSVGDTEFTMFPKSLYNMLVVFSEVGINYAASEMPRTQSVMQFPPEDYYEAVFMFAYAATIRANNGDDCRIWTNDKALGMSVDDALFIMEGADCENLWKARLIDMNARREAVMAKYRH